MKKIHYITGNDSKFNNAKGFFEKENISITQTKLDIYEMQDFDSLVIAESKAEQAWEKLGEPLFINDACWIIPSLNGFPGPYMKYINKWFTPNDFINLMKDKDDRTVILRDTIIYADKDGLKTFTNDHFGTILDHPYDGEFKSPSDAVISLSESGMSIAQEVAKKKFFLKGEDLVWNNFINWLKNK